MSELVLRQDRDGVATLTLNRPEALNALNIALFTELREHVAAIAGQTDSVGCVVLRGEGRAFSAGNDLKALGDPAPEPYYQAETIDMIEALPQPVIASVRGACYTGALELMLAADLCIAGESAIFCDSHGEWALTPLWGLTQRLPRRIGPLLAREMMYTARRVDAHEPSVSASPTASSPTPSSTRPPPPWPRRSRATRGTRCEPTSASSTRA